MLKNAGLPPGTLTSSPDGAEVGVTQTLYTYNETECIHKKSIEDTRYRDLLSDDKISWFNIDGVHQSRILENIGRAFGIHPLALEDIQDVEHRPKVEDYDEYVFIIFKMLQWDAEQDEVEAEQICLIVGKNYVISFQEHEGDVFDELRNRIVNGRGRVRKEGAAYLAYALLDSVVDQYFLLLEAVENRFEELEDEIILTPRTDAYKQVIHLKKQLITVRRNLWPLQELLYRIQKEEIPLVGPNVLPFFRDVHDHTLRLMDIVEVLRDTSTSLLDLHNTNVNNTMNSVMKVLTIIATIFIPITFVAGIYGMNFNYMPELSVKWAYPAVLGVMGGVAVGMILYFKKKNWL